MQLFSAVQLLLAPWISLDVIKGGARVELHSERPPNLTRNALDVSDTAPVAVTDLGVGAGPGAHSLWPNASTRALGRRLSAAEDAGAEAMHAVGTSLGMLTGYFAEDGRVDEVEAKEVVETLGVGVVNAAGTAFGPFGMLIAGFGTGLYSGFTSPPLETQLEELKKDRAFLHYLGLGGLWWFFEKGFGGLANPSNTPSCTSLHMPQEILEEVGPMIDKALAKKFFDKHVVELKHFTKQLQWAYDALPLMEPESRISYALALEHEAGSLRDSLFFECVQNSGSQECSWACKHATTLAF